MKPFSFIAIAALAGLSGLALSPPARADAPAAPIRHLVYGFTWGTSNTTETHTSGMRDSGNPSGMNGSGGASGMAQSSGGTSDKGTIVVDVLREQPDKGLVVDISEQARERRSAAAARCVVFGNTTVVCDPSKKINAEELTLLRFLGSNFVDPNALDAKSHWQVTQGDSGYSTTADYTIAKNADGIMTIDEARIVKDSSGTRPQTTNVTATIGYDFGRTVPTSISEYIILRSEVGENYDTVKTQTQLTLQSDSLAKS